MEDKENTPGRRAKGSRKPAAKPAAKKASPKPAVKGAKPVPGRRVVAKKAPAKKAPAKKAPKQTDAASKAASTAAAQKAAATSVENMVEEAHRAVGRPTKYRDEFIPMMLAYFSIDVERVEETVMRDAKGNPVIVDGKPLMDKHVVVNKFPSLERFAANIGVTRETLHDWATATDAKGALLRPEFSYTYARAKTLVAAILQEGGMAGNYPERLTSFALKNLAGWKEQIEQTIVAEVNTTSKEDLDALYAEKMAESDRQRDAVLAERKQIENG